MKILIKLILILCFLSPATLHAQKVKKVTKKSKDYVETYFVLKDNKRVKHGMYEETYNRRLVKRGNYNQGNKDGKWMEIRGWDTLQTFYELGHLDSFYGKKNGQLIGIKYDQKGKEISRYYGKPEYNRVNKKIGKNTLVVQTRKFGFNTDTTMLGLLNNGKKEGAWITMDEQDYTSVMHFKKGKKIGRQRSFYPKGNTFIDKTYNNDGKLEGPYITYSKDGDTLTYANYINGVKHGRAIAKYKNGTVFYTAEYNQNRLINYSEFNSSGNANKLSYVKEGTGVLYTYMLNDDDEIQVSSKYEIENGLPHGVAQFFKDNELTESKQYEHGMFQKFIVKNKDSKTPKNIDTVYVSPSSYFIGYYVSSMAMFIGGEQALYRHIAENTKYPDLALENDVQGSIMVQFVIDQLGNVTNLQIISSKKGFGLEEESMRVVELTSGLWTPASQQGFPVKMRYRLPVKFQIF
jgi:TonB family protein